MSSVRQPDLPEIENFKTYSIGKSENPELIVVRTNNDNTAGFIVSLENLWNNTINQLLSENRTEYRIELLSGGNSNIYNDGLSIRAELSTCFPLQRIVIKPANEKIVEEFVRNRSWIYGIALVLLLGGMSLGIFLILRDIRREKRMADMQSEFVSHVTHELKTPLTSINMFAETIFLDRAKSEESRKKYANIIMKESEVLKRKIDNILEYSVRKNEKSKYKIRETNLSMLVDEVMEEMKYWLDINNFEVSVDKGNNVVANVDPEAIKQALSNLIGNAIKYSADRKQLFVRLFRKDDIIILEVEDKGIGIPKDQVDLIFEKFYRVNSRESESTTGTGLGLSVTRDIVNAHGGKIFVESEVNKGSKFTIQLNT
jgi:two-component system phosphate regulon sensor histidine kinase PhoR